MKVITQANITGLDDTHLSSVDAYHYLHVDVATPFIAMQQAAFAEEIDLQLVSSYRSFERQLSIWNKKWRGELPLISLDGNTRQTERLNDDEKLHAILLWSALPGASRHHWGTDFDVYDKKSVAQCNHRFELVVEEYTNGGPCNALFNWLQANASTFGFSFPYSTYVGGVAKEPWHLSYSPLSEQIISLFNKDFLRQLISESHIEGKHVILNNFDDIITRYMLNKGTQ